MRSVIHGIKKQEPIIFMNRNPITDLIIAKTPENYLVFAPENPIASCPELDVYVAMISGNELEEERIGIFKEIAVVIDQEKVQNLLFGVMSYLLKLKGKPGWTIF